MKWIKHDTDANQDAKLQNVLLDYGLEGYGLYWYCIELIAWKVDKDNITFELEHDARIIARNVGSTAQKVEEIMRYFVKTGLFEDSNGVITCLKIARRLDQSMTSNKQMREIIDNLKSHDSVMIESAKPMQDKIRGDESIKDVGDKSPVPLQHVLDAYHELLPMMPSVQIYTEKRKSMVRTFWKKRTTEHKAAGKVFTIDSLRGYFNYIANHCQWMLTDRENGKGGMWKVKNFDYVMKEDCYVAVKEQRFDNKGN